jgi:hypothetical protein
MMPDLTHGLVPMSSSGSITLVLVLVENVEIEFRIAIVGIINSTNFMAHDMCVVARSGLLQPSLSIPSRSS